MRPSNNPTNVNNLTNKAYLISAVAAFRLAQLHLAAGRNNPFWKVILGKKPRHCIVLFYLTLDWEELPKALIIS